jgi:ferredoxin
VGLRVPLLPVQRPVHDGPGIRTAVFLKGCPLHCGWCHNPESQRPDPQLLVREHRCLHCGACIAKGLSLTGRSAGTATASSPTASRRCRSAAPAPTPARPRRARWWAGEMTVAEVLREVERDRPFFDESGGGVTVSGGEPLAQPDFTAGAADRLPRARTAHRPGHVGPRPDRGDPGGRGPRRPRPVRPQAPRRRTPSRGHRRGQRADPAQPAAAAGRRRRRARAHPAGARLQRRSDRPARAAALVAALEPVPPVELLPFHRRPRRSTGASACPTARRRPHPRAGRVGSVPRPLRPGRGAAIVGGEG